MERDATPRFAGLEVPLVWALVTPGEAAHALENPGDEWLARAEKPLLGALTLEGRRREWCAGRLAVKRAVQQWWQVTRADPLAAAQVTVTQDERGAPHVLLPGDTEAPPVSIAHTDGYGFAAVVPPGLGVRIGVDVERLRDISPRLLERLLSPDETGSATLQPPDAEPLDGVTLWTLKEATVKALGLGLRLPMRCLTVQVTAPGRAHVHRVDTLPSVDDFVASPWTATGCHARSGNLAFAIVVVRRRGGMVDG
jgi:phosphopantetheinyl transferase